MIHAYCAWILRGKGIVDVIQETHLNLHKILSKSPGAQMLE